MFAFVFCISLCAPSAYPYVIVLKNGKTLHGTFVREDDASIIVKDDKGTVLSFKKTTLDLEKMRLSPENSSSNQDSNKVENANPPRPKESVAEPSMVDPLKRVIEASKKAKAKSDSSLFKPHQVLTNKDVAKLPKPHSTTENPPVTNYSSTVPGSSAGNQQRPLPTPVRPIPSAADVTKEFELCINHMGNQGLDPNDAVEVCTAAMRSKIAAIKNSQYRQRECVEGLSINWVSDDGEYLGLSDDSVWSVASFDTTDSSLWHSGSGVVVCRDKIINLDGGETVEAERLPDGGTLSGDLAGKQTVIQASSDDQTFLVDGCVFEAKIYCFDVREGDKVIFVSRSSVACVSTEFVILRTGKTCEVWCK